VTNQQRRAPGMPRPNQALSPCHPVTVSPCSPVTVSPCSPVTLQPCHRVTLQPCHPVTVSLCSFVTPQPCPRVPLQRCHPTSPHWCHCGPTGFSPTPIQALDPILKRVNYVNRLIKTPAWDPALLPE
uniref:Uncharacterized protein n=1 Tax=Taeniopygia guttata TaxID=59729 RepID=A0A674GX75_TAEGU